MSNQTVETLGAQVRGLEATCNEVLRALAEVREIKSKLLPEKQLAELAQALRNERAAVKQDVIATGTVESLRIRSDELVKFSQRLQTMTTECRDHTNQMCHDIRAVQRAAEVKVDALAVEFSVVSRAAEAVLTLDQRVEDLEKLNDERVLQQSCDEVGQDDSDDSDEGVRHAEMALEVLVAYESTALRGLSERARARYRDCKDRLDNYIKGRRW